MARVMGRSGSSEARQGFVVERARGSCRTGGVRELGIVRAGGAIGSWRSASVVGAILDGRCWSKESEAGEMSVVATGTA